MRFDVPKPIQTAPVHEPEHKPKRARRRLPKLRFTTNTIVIATCILTVAVLATLSAFLYLDNKKLRQTSGGQTSTNDQVIVDRTIKNVGKLYALPSDEKPTVATIRDVSQIKGQAFFKNAQNGDRLLVYSKNKFAILYRESENKIINIGPVSTDQQNSPNGAPAAQRNSR